MASPAGNFFSDVFLAAFVDQRLSILLRPHIDRRIPQETETVKIELQQINPRSQTTECPPSSIHEGLRLAAVRCEYEQLVAIWW